MWIGPSWGLGVLPLEGGRAKKDGDSSVHTQIQFMPASKDGPELRDGVHVVGLGQGVGISLGEGLFFECQRCNERIFDNFSATRACGTRSRDSQFEVTLRK